MTDHSLTHSLTVITESAQFSLYRICPFTGRSEVYVPMPCSFFIWSRPIFSRSNSVKCCVAAVGLTVICVVPIADTLGEPCTLCGLCRQPKIARSFVCRLLDSCWSSAPVMRFHSFQQRASLHQRGNCEVILMRTSIKMLSVPVRY